MTTGGRALARPNLVVVVALVVLLAACGGGSSTPAAGNPSPGAGQTAKPLTTATPAGQGTVDCAALKTAAQQLLAVQLLAQLKTPDAVEGIKTKQIGDLDIDAFLAAMGTLHALDSVASPFGDAKTAIASYEKAGAAAKVLFATDPITQAAIDTYNLNVGTVSDFLGHQIAISGAMSTAGC